MIHGRLGGALKPSGRYGRYNESEAAGGSLEDIMLGLVSGYERFEVTYYGFEAAYRVLTSGGLGLYDELLNTILSGAKNIDREDIIEAAKECISERLFREHTGDEIISVLADGRAARESRGHDLFVSYDNKDGRSWANGVKSAIGGVSEALRYPDEIEVRGEDETPMDETELVNALRELAGKSMDRNHMYVKYTYIDDRTSPARCSRGRFGITFMGNERVIARANRMYATLKQLNVIGKVCSVDLA